MEIELKNPDIRKLKDIESVLLNKDIVKDNPDKEIYYMYRGIKEENGLRYDITIIPPFLMGEEYVKTKGHYHCANYGEIYTVIKGEAIFLMQKGTDEIEDVYAIFAKAGESIIIPSKYAHITINASNEILELANWVSVECSSDYDTIKNKNGACYFYTTKGWVKNNNYKNIPEIRFEEPLKEAPNNLDFLK